MNKTLRSIETDAGPMNLLVELPQAQTAAPAVIICMHAPGLDNFIGEIGRRLAAQGFAAYAPDFYHRQEDASADPLVRLGKLKDAELETDLAAVHAHILRQGHAGIGVLGFCMGGRIALIGASMLSALDATVSFYGGFIRESWGPGRAPIERVDSIGCPVLMVGGELDTNPSPKDIQDLSAAFEAAGKAHQVRMYEGVGHAFLNFNRSGYQEEKAMRAWAECEAFLGAHLRD